MNTQVHILTHTHTQHTRAANTCSLLLFGGWSNRWLGDTLKLNVSPIIGPPYACTGIQPESGPVFGSTDLVVKGLRFKSGEIKVKFGTG
jgi:dynein heavy chain